MSPTGDTIEYTYDALGHETTQTIGSETWTVTYDADGNAVKTVNPDGGTAKYTFDAMNRKIGETYLWADGTGNAQYALPVTWTYNKLGQRTQMTQHPIAAGASPTTTTYRYDSQGRLLTADTAEPSGDSQDFSYDYSTPGRFSETYPDGATITYHTDDGGNLMGVSVPAQSDGSPAFDTGNMLPTTKVTQGATDSATAGSSAGAVTPNAPSGTLYPDMLIGYTFNEPHADSIGTATLTSGTAFYSAGMANSTTSSNPEPPQGVYIAQSDLNGNLLNEQWATLPAPGATVGTVMNMEYGYNAGALNSAVDETSTNGSGDQGGVQLTSWSSSYSSVQTMDQEAGSYAYNGDGNPTMVTTGPQGQQGLSWAPYYDSTGEITSVWTNAPNPANTPNSDPVFSYDNSGDMTQAGAVEPAGHTLQQAGTAWKFLYNDAGQLAIATETEANGSIQQVNYAYDGDGNLVSEIKYQCCGYTEERSISLIWDPRPSTPQLVEADDTQFANGGATTTHQRYFWGNGPLGMESDGSEYVFHDNQNGTPTMVTNMSGKTVASTFDDPHGNFLDGSNVSGQTFLIGFDASYSDPFTGLDLWVGAGMTRISACS